MGYKFILVFIHLFVQRPPGIMCTLDDVCSTMHAVTEGSEKNLMEVYNIINSNKLTSLWKKHFRMFLYSSILIALSPLRRTNHLSVPSLSLAQRMTEASFFNA